jgi:hypothetical protein
MLSILITSVLGCSGTPMDSLSWREQWELLVLTEDGSLIEGRVSVGNTGMMRGQGHFRANRWNSGTTPILFAMDGGPGDVHVSDSHNAVRVGTDLFGQYEDGPHWTMRLSHEEANAIIQVDPGGPEVPMATAMENSGQWTVASPITHGRAQGWFTAGRRGGMFRGRAVTFHRGGDGRPPTQRSTLVAMGTDVSIGWDNQGSTRLAWARMKDEDISVEDLLHSVQDDGMHRLDFRPAGDLVVDFEPTTTGGITDGFEKLYAPERAIAETAGLYANRATTRARATVRFKGASVRVPAILVTVD